MSPVFPAVSCGACATLCRGGLSFPVCAMGPHSCVSEEVSPHSRRRPLGPRVPASQCDAGQPCALAAGTRDLPRTQREARATCTSRISGMRHPRSCGRALSPSPQEPGLGAGQLSGCQPSASCDRNPTMPNDRKASPCSVRNSDCWRSERA